MQSTVKLTYAESHVPFVKRTTISAIEVICGRRRLEKLYNQALFYSSRKGISFWQAALDSLKISLHFEPEQLSKIPTSGPLLVIANHPFGVVDGIMICHLISKVRSDFKVLLHKTLCREPEIAPYTLPVDFSETKEALKTNIESKRQALNCLKSNGCVIVFPGGGVSTAKKVFGRAEELEWKPFPARLAQDTKATVVPFYFEGQNSLLFQAVSKISATLRSSMHIREVRNKVGRTFKVHIGNPILYNQLNHIENRGELTRWLYERTHNISADKNKKD